MGKIFANHITNTGLVSRICKEQKDKQLSLKNGQTSRRNKRKKYKFCFLRAKKSSSYGAKILLVPPSKLTLSPPGPLPSGPARGCRGLSPALRGRLRTEGLPPGFSPTALGLRSPLRCKGAWGGARGRLHPGPSFPALPLHSSLPGRNGLFRPALRDLGLLRPTSLPSRPALLGPETRAGGTAGKVASLLLSQCPRSPCSRGSQPMRAEGSALGCRLAPCRPGLLDVAGLGWAPAS